jgi:hypothetical protein
MPRTDGAVVRINRSHPIAVVDDFSSGGFTYLSILPFDA